MSIDDEENVESIQHLGSGHADLTNVSGREMASCVVRNQSASRVSSILDTRE